MKDQTDYRAIEAAAANVENIARRLTRPGATPKQKKLLFHNLHRLFELLPPTYKASLLSPAVAELRTADQLQEPTQ